MTEERKDAIGLLAEKVMKFPGMKDVTRDFLFAKWNPFAKPADSVAIAEALRKQGFMVTIMAKSDGYTVIVNAGNLAASAEGQSFAETLTTAIHRLVVERPELFAEGK